jgi:DNA-binding NarL/FixJ family response regulator
MCARVLRSAGMTGSAIVARLNVTELARHAPDLIVCDVDGVVSDPLEFIRQVRSVLPKCVIAVYSRARTKTWADACHLAGATCLLSKASSVEELSNGLREGTISGCYTDSRFDAA